MNGYLTVKWYSINFTEYTIVDGNELRKQQSFANRNAIFWIFSVPLKTRWHINWYYYVQKAPRAVPANRKRQSKTWLYVVNNSTNNSSSNVNNGFLYSEKEHAVLTGPKDRPVKHYYQTEKRCDSNSIGSDQQ